MLIEIILDFLLDLFIYAGIPILAMIVGGFILAHFSNGEENWHDAYPPSGWTRRK